MVDKFHPFPSFYGILQKEWLQCTHNTIASWMHEKHDAKNGGEIVCISYMNLWYCV